MLDNARGFGAPAVWRTGANATAAEGVCRVGRPGDRRTLRCLARPLLARLWLLVFLLAVSGAVLALSIIGLGGGVVLLAAAGILAAVGGGASGIVALLAALPSGKRTAVNLRKTPMRPLSHRGTG